MAEIDVKFSKGNKYTVKAMSTVYKDNPKKTVKKSTTKKGKK